MTDGDLRVLAIEPYYGGSHRAVLDGLVASVPADWTLLTLPARKWKWRMRGAAITMAEQARASCALTSRKQDDGDRSPYDLVFTSTFLNLAEFLGLAGPEFASIPSIVYFHENQLLYPNRHTAEWDYQFPLTNITSALAATSCLFNTRWNLTGFLTKIDPFLREFPDHRPLGVSERIAEKSTVLAPPFDPTPFDAEPFTRSQRCRIVWPHRWEHDKDPDTFFAAVNALAAEGLDFEVAVAGQSFAETRGFMSSTAEALGSRLVHCAEPADRAEYARLLASADVAVSTALNEFFGIAMIEACYAGCMPLVPDRLAYPDIYPAEFRYRTREELVARLRAAILHRPAPGCARDLAERYTFLSLAPEYAAHFERTAAMRG